MCTALAWNSGNFYFGRNMDLEYNFGQQVVILPRGYELSFKAEKSITSGHFAIIGMASLIDNYPLFEEAANEKGLCVAALNFPQYAFQEQEVLKEKYNVTAYEIIPWILAQCKTTKEAKLLLLNTRIVAIPFKDGLPLPTLHFMVSDKESSIVFEYTKEGVKIFDNPYGVLTNSPAFDFHLTNIANYINCTPQYPKNSFSDKHDITPLGVGAGGFGIPGDASTTSRFIRGVFHKVNSPCNLNKDEALSQFFHVLDSVAMLRGSSFTENGAEDLTLYTSCIDVSELIYYYKTYHNNQISAVYGNKVDLNSDTLFSYSLQTKQNIFNVN